MAAELTFKNVLSHIQQSGLNFSIYLTPFSAQLSLKKSFAKKFYQEPVDEVKIEENLGHSLEAKVEQLESRLKKIDSENHKLVENLKEREEALELFKLNVI
jgi:predicted nuclease with TOPRIM domain